MDSIMIKLDYAVGVSLFWLSKNDIVITSSREMVAWAIGIHSLLVVRWHNVVKNTPSSKVDEAFDS